MTQTSPVPGPSSPATTPARGQPPAEVQATDPSSLSIELSKLGIPEGFLLKHEGRALTTPVALQYVAMAETHHGLMVTFTDGTHNKELLMSERWAAMFRKTDPVIIHIFSIIHIMEVKKKKGTGLPMVVTIQMKPQQKTLRMVGRPLKQFL